MKKFLFLFATLLAGCAVPPPILTATYSLELPSGAGVNSTTNFTDFSSSLASGKTKLTFSNKDGDVLQFLINGLHAGNTYELATNPMTGVFTIQDETGQLTSVNIQSSGVGSIKIDGMSGSGGNVQGLAGSFQASISIGGQEEADIPTTSGTGTMYGNIGFNNAAAQ